MITYVSSLGLYRTFSICGYMAIESVRGWVSYFYQPPVEKLKNHYVITYTYNMKEYKVLCKRNRSRIRILHIKDENENDIGDKIKPFMGPAYDFHRIPTSPADLGYKKLSFYMLNGEQKTYNENDIIII